jgi:hypothetical protein
MNSQTKERVDNIAREINERHEELSIIDRDKRMTGLERVYLQRALARIDDGMVALRLITDTPSPRPVHPS